MTVEITSEINDENCKEAEVITKRRQLIVVEDNNVLQIVEAKKDSEDDSEKFLFDQIFKLECYVRRFDKESIYKRPGIRRTSEEKRKYINENGPLKRERQFKLNVLRGKEKTLLPVIIRNDQNEIKGWTWKELKAADDVKWLRFIANQVQSVFDLHKDDEMLYDLAKEAYDLRLDMKYGFDERTRLEAQDNYDGYYTNKINKLYETDRENADKFGPILKEISNKA